MLNAIYISLILAIIIISIYEYFEDRKFYRLLLIGAPIVLISFETPIARKINKPIAIGLIVVLILLSCCTFYLVYKDEKNDKK